MKKEVSSFEVPEVPSYLVIDLKNSKHKLVTKFVIYLINLGFIFIEGKSIYDLDAFNKSAQYIWISIPTKYGHNITHNKIFNFAENTATESDPIINLRENYDWIKYACKVISDRNKE